MDDSYTGQVTVDGPAEVRTLTHIRITKVAVDPQMANNAYVIECLSSGDQVLIDAADDAPRLLQHLDPSRLRAIVTTHQHWDHIRALADVVKVSSAPVLAGEPDSGSITEQTGVPVATQLDHGATITFGGCELGVVRLTGHTPGSVALVHRDAGARNTVHLFTGDSLFPGGPGRTTGPDDFRSLMDDLESRVFDVFPDDTWVYPGHGNDTTLGAERPHVAEWKARGW